MNKFRVGKFLIESDLNSITGSEQSIRVEPKVMQVLLCLVAYSHLWNRDLVKLDGVNARRTKLTQILNGQISKGPIQIMTSMR